jgi:hypothetical protein
MVAIDKNDKTCSKRVRLEESIHDHLVYSIVEYMLEFHIHFILL